MPDQDRPQSTPAPRTRRELEALEAGSRGDSFRQILAKPVVVVAILLGLGVVGIVVYLQQGPSALTLEAPEARYELLRNQGLTQGVPISIQLGPLTVFHISDPMAGGAGAVRAKQVVDSLSAAVQELSEAPGRVITIDTGAPEGMPRVVQKETADSSASLEIVSVTSDDMLLAETDDAKLLARIWAERLTDSLRLLIFGQPPEFSRDTSFGAGLDVLHGTAMRESGSLTSDSLMAAFNELSADLQEALTSFPALPSMIESSPGATSGDTVGDSS